MKITNLAKWEPGNIITKQTWARLDFRNFKRNTFNYENDLK